MSSIIIRRLRTVCTIVAILGTVLCQAAPPASVTTRLAANGVALQPIVIGEQASAGVKHHATTLADMLGKISGATFTVKTGNGTSGIALGTPADFPALTVNAPFDGKNIYQREQYLLRTHAKGLYVLGATDLAVQHAVWQLLYRLGYRQFFPGNTWEIIPSQRALAIAVDLQESPDFNARTIWYQWGTTNAPEFQDWCAKNRMANGIAIQNLHYYNYFISENKAVFDAHPEYYGLVKGERKSSKLCVSNAELRALVAATAVRYFEKYPDRDCISLEPTDGGGWCECALCAPIAISDRVVMLANAAADAIAQRYGADKFVGILGYFQHNLPPTIKIHPQVNVCIANGLMGDGRYNVFELLDRWGAQGGWLGVYEYYSVCTWWRDMPGRPTGANLTRISTAIPRYHQKGARVFTAESGDNWAPNGLGYYLTARLLWDTDEAKVKDAIVADFLDKCFGPAKKPMGEFYAIIDGSNKDEQLDDIVGKMYRKLDEARKLSRDPRVTARINDLILYTRYVELYRLYAAAKDDARQQGFEAVLRYVYRIRKTGMVHTVALFQDIPGFDKKVTLPKEASWFVPEGKNPWKSPEPISDAEIQQFLADGIKNNPVLDFTLVKYSTNLVSAAPLKLPEVPLGNLFIYPYAGTAGQAYYTLVPEKTQSLRLLASGDKRKVKLYAGDDETAIDEITLNKPLPVTVMPETDEFAITLHPKSAGLHRIVVEGGGVGATQLNWSNMPMTINANFSRFNYASSTLYFYVPKGTTRVIGKCDSLVGGVMDGSGKMVLRFKDLTTPGYFTIPVPPGQDGTLWKFDKISGHRWLYTVPPYLARNGNELLLPAEVVQKDTAK